MPSAEENRCRDVEIRFNGQRFRGCNVSLMFAAAIERMQDEMSEFTEGQEAIKTEITKVNLCVQKIDQQLSENGNGGTSRRSLKRDAAIIGGGGGVAGLFFGVIVYLEQIINFFKALFGGAGSGL